MKQTNKHETNKQARNKQTNKHETNKQQACNKQTSM
jgi:hypothetical protein